MPRSLERPAHPERVCWGCDRYCSAQDLACGKDTVRTPHPIELFGEDWQDWSRSLDSDGAARPRDDAQDLQVSETPSANGVSLRVLR